MDYEALARRKSTMDYELWTMDYELWTMNYNTCVCLLQVC